MSQQPTTGSPGAGGTADGATTAKKSYAHTVAAAAAAASGSPSSSSHPAPSSPSLAFSAVAAGSSSSSQSSQAPLPASSPAATTAYSAPNSPPSVPQPSPLPSPSGLKPSASPSSSSSSTKHPATASANRSIRRPGEVHAATMPASSSSSCASASGMHLPSASPPLSAASTPHGVPGAFVLLPTAPVPVSQRPRSRSLGALHGAEFLSKQARRAHMAGKSRTATIQMQAAHAQLFANSGGGANAMMLRGGGRNNSSSKLSPPIEEGRGRGGSDRGGDSSSSPPTKSSAAISSPTYSNAGLPPRSGGGASGLTLPASSAALVAKLSPLLSGSSLLMGSSIFGPHYSDATSTTSVLGSGGVMGGGGVGAGGVGSVLEMIPDLGGRAQSASSSLRRMPQSQSATSSPHASDTAFYPAELLELGEIGIGTGDFLFAPGLAGTTGGGSDSSVPSSTAAAGSAAGSFASMGLSNYSFNAGSGAGSIFAPSQPDSSPMVHPEGGRMQTPLQSVGELDEIDMSLILMKLIHDRSNALEQRLTSRNRAETIYARERMQQQQQQQHQQQHLAHSNSAPSASTGAPSAGARMSAADRGIPQIPEEALQNLSPPSSSPDSAVVVPSPPSALPNLPAPAVVFGSPPPLAHSSVKTVEAPLSPSPLPCPSPPSPATSSSSSSAGGPANAASQLPRFVVSELNLISRQMEKVIALLYKSKLSLSLRTVQLRRHMREQFLNDLNHPARTQTSEDAEIARWIASSAFSNSEIADSQKNAQTGNAQTESKTDEADQSACGAEGEGAEDDGAAGDSDQEPLSGSPVDLTVSHTPKSSRNASVVYVSAPSPPSDATAAAAALPVPVVAIPFSTLGSSSGSLASSSSSPPPSTISPATAAATMTPTTTPGAGPITPSTVADAAVSVGPPTLPSAPSFPGPQHSSFSPVSNTGSPSPPAVHGAASVTSSVSPARNTPNPPVAPVTPAHVAHSAHGHGGMPATLYPPSAPASAASSASSGAGSDRRSGTPIILADETNISQLIGSGFNSSKRGSTILPGPGGSQGPPMPGTQIRRSSTSDPITTAKTSSASGSPLLLARGRIAGSSGNLVGAAAASPALPSLNAGAHSPSMGAVGAQHQPPMTTLALAGGLGADSSSSALAPRSVSHPSSPGLAPFTINAPSPAGPRCFSADTKTPKKAENAHASSTALTPSPGTGAVGSSSHPPPAGRRHSRIYFTLSPPVTEALHSIWRWEFDIWEFADLVPETPLTTISCYLLERWGLFQTFNMDRATFHRFIERIEEGYLANPYHNKIHAADVVQNIHVLLLGFMAKPSKDNSGALCTSLTPLDVLSCIIAAAIHDVGHTGTTNLFHTASVSDLAITYNDVSVLENMSVSQTFELILRHKEYDIFASLTRDQKREARETIIAMVLATDMKNHIGMLTDLQATVEQKKTTGKAFDVASRTDRLLLLKNCLHLSDVANPTKPTAMCVRWADAIVAEWFSQGDMERSLKLEISPMMDRRNANVEKSQIGFIDFFITPLLATWVAITPQASICQEYLKTNRAFWTARMQANEATKASEAAAAATAAAAAATANASATVAATSTDGAASSSSSSAVPAVSSPPPSSSAASSSSGSGPSSAASTPNKKPLGSS